MTTTFNVSLFAGAADAAGESLLSLELPRPKVPLRDLATELVLKHPELTSWVACSRWAVDHEFAQDETVVIKADSEIALIPPVSGG